MSREGGIFPGGVGSCIFGEHNVARLPEKDKVNDFLRNQYLGDYLKFQ